MVWQHQTTIYLKLCQLWPCSACDLWWGENVLVLHVFLLPLLFPQLAYQRLCYIQLQTSPGLPAAQLVPVSRHRGRQTEMDLLDSASTCTAVGGHHSAIYHPQFFLKPYCMDNLPTPNCLPPACLYIVRAFLPLKKG